MTVERKSDAAGKLNAAIDTLSGASRMQKRIAMMAVDALLCVLAVWFAYYLRLGEWRLFTEDVLKLTVGALAFWYPAAFLVGVYRELFRYAGGWALVMIARAIGLMLIPMITVYLFILIPGVPRTLSVLQPIIFFLFISFSRVTLRFVILDLRQHFGPNARGRRQILIYGAGRSGQQLAGSIVHEPDLYLVGFVDDDVRKKAHRINRKPIWHSSELAELIPAKSITDVFITLTKVPRKKRADIISRVAENNVQVMTLPKMRTIIDGDASLNDLREVEIADLLGRNPVAPDAGLLKQSISGKTVLVTGAGGSIGSELCRIIADLSPERLILLEANEYALYSIDLELVQRAHKTNRTFPIIPELCNVADRSSVQRVVSRHRPDTVYHAAAYKHVPLVEANVLGGARNNVLGTWNLVKACIANGTERFILISTDKAVRPTNIMGASKRICEQILQAHAQTADEDSPVFTMVRFGNVLGSSGSVVPLFKRQIQMGGPITLTDRRITRYFMTVNEAAELVVQAGAMAEGGEVYVLDMGSSVEIYNLARTMIQLSGLSVRDECNPDGDIEIREVGLRPGEKLFEELLIGSNPSATSHERIFQAREGHLSLDCLTDAVRSLSVMIENGESDAVRSLIAQLVPEYTAVDHLDIRE